MQDKDYIQNYEKFVRNSMKQYEALTDLIHDNEITPYVLNKALASYFKIHLSVITEYQILKSKFQIQTLGYKEWYAEKLEEAKEQVISEYSKSAKPAKYEFENRVQVLYKTEMREKQLELFETENNMKMLSKVLDALKRYDNVLCQLSNNMRSELKSLSLEKRAIGDISTYRTKV